MRCSKFLLGVGIGATVSAVISCFLHTPKGRKMRMDARHAIYRAEEEAENMYYEMRDRAREMKRNMVGHWNDEIDCTQEKVNDAVDSVQEKVNKKVDAAQDKLNKLADSSIK